jgi:predicted TIM-barrel fold metal-dependent hydrolase
MRGLRLQLHWHENEQYRFASAPDAMHDPVFRDNVGRLAQLGWVFELQVFAAPDRDAATLVRRPPDVQFVLIHAGMPEGDLGLWRASSNGSPRSRTSRSSSAARARSCTGSTAR